MGFVINEVEIEKVEGLIKSAFKSGYGDTVELKINGEYYEVVL